MKKITMYFTLVFFVAFSWQGQAQTVCNQTFSASGLDADPTVLTINAADVTCNAGETINSIAIGNSAGNLTNSFCGSWYDFTLNVDGTDVVTGCATDFDGYDVTGFSTITITSADLDAWVDSVTIELDLIVDHVTPSCPTPTAMADTNLAFTSVDLSWTAGASETMWEVVYDADPYAMPANGMTDATGEPNYEHLTSPALNLTGLADGTTYNVYYRAHCGGTDYSGWASYSFSTPALPPVNDDCATPDTLTVFASGMSVGNETVANSSGATESAQGQTSCDSLGTNLDMFYEFTVPAGEDTVYVLTGGATGSDIELVLFDTCGGTEIAGTCGGTSSLHILTGLTANTTYLLQVWHDSFNAGEFTIALESAPPPPANNDLANAEMLTVNATCVNTLGTIVGATASGMPGIATCGSTDGTEPDVWYSFVAPSDGNITITTSIGTGANLDTVIGLYSYDGTNITELGCNDDAAAPFSEIAITDGSLVAGDTYYVQVHEFNGDNVDDFNICVVGTVASPCGDPSNLSAVVANTYVDFAWDAGADGETMWDFELGLLGFVVDTGAEELRLDDLTENPVQIAGFAPGTDYEFYVRAVCSATLSSNWVGPFAFTTTAVVPANDLCANATPLTVGISRNDNQVFDSNSMATDSGEVAPGCASYNGGDLWYSAVVPASGRIYFETFSGFGGDGGLAVYSGSCGALTEIACSDDEGLDLYGLIKLEGQTPGDILYARVWEFGGNATINFNIVAYSPTCDVPTNFVATTTLDTADITWDAGSDGETMWDFEYGLAGFAQGTGTMQTEITTNAPNALTGLTQSTTYDFYVRAVCTSGVSTSDWVGPMSFTTLTPPPSNDDCTSPDTLIVYGSGMSAGNETAANSAGATESAQGQTSCDSIGTNLDMFYEFTVPAGEDTVYVLTGGATGDDIELVLFDACGGTEIPNTCGNNDSQHILTGLTGGTTYLLQVWHDSFNAGEFTIALESAPACPTPTAMATANLTDVSVDLSWTAGASETMWEVVYDADPYAMPANGMTDATGEPNYEHLTSPALNLSGLTDSTTYNVYYRAHCGGTDYSDWVSFTFTTPAPPPANDDCAGAITIACDDVIAGDTTSATPEVIGSYTGGNEDARSVWYTFVGDGSAVTLSTCNDASYDTKIDVYSGDCATLTHVAGNDDGAGCSGFSSLVADMPTVSGTTYYVRVYGFAALSNGTFNLTMTCAAACTPVVANQDCASADALTLGVTTSSDNTCASANLTNPLCDLFGVIKDVWFTVDATSDQLNITTTLGTATDVNVAVYEGVCGTLNQISTACASSPGIANALSLTGLTPGNTYYIQVWNAGGAEEGTFDIIAEAPTASVESLDTVGFRYFPNPVTNNLQLQANENIKSVAVFNMLGQEVISARPSALETSLNMANLASGTYFVKAQVGDAVGTFKVVKK